MTTDKLELFIVTCRSLHRAVGPFVGLRDAIEAAKMLNAYEGKGGCIYLPVPFEAQYRIVGTTEAEQKDSPPRYRGQGYL